MTCRGSVCFLLHAFVFSCLYFRGVLQLSCICSNFKCIRLYFIMLNVLTIFCGPPYYTRYHKRRLKTIQLLVLFNEITNANTITNSCYVIKYRM